jgi:hypothetical protein
MKENNNQEIDLSNVFKALKKAIISFVEFLKDLSFLSFRYARKNFILLIIGAILGLVLALFVNHNFKAQRVYEMVVAPEPYASVMLYEQFSKSDTLSKIKDVDAIYIKPIKSYKSGLDLLLSRVEAKEVTHKVPRSTQIYAEGVKIDIDGYIKSIKKYEYPTHKIKVYTSKKIDVSSIQEAIIKSVEQSPQLIAYRNSELSILESTKKRVQENLDNLNLLVKKNINAKIEPSLTKMTIIDKQNTSSIFNSALDLSDKITELDYKINQNKKSIFILSDLNYTGITTVFDDLTTIQPQQDNIIIFYLKFIAKGVLFILLILFTLGIFRYLLKNTKPTKLN